MSTLIVVDGDRGETRSQAVARRLRGKFAERQLSVSEVARRLGVTQQKLSRRMTGEVPFDVDELDAICTAAEISFAYVTSGIAESPRPRPDGGSSLSAPDLVSERSPVQTRQGALLRFRGAMMPAEQLPAAS